jgi:two-component system, OmpR family, response regulator
VDVLVVEDDLEAAALLLEALRETGHAARTVADGRHGLKVAMTEPCDVLVVDRMLPGMDGLSLVTALRASGNATPVLILSALADVDHRIQGLRAGSDDYLIKPYAFAELLARLEALVRRKRGEFASDALRVADLELNRLTRSAYRGRRHFQLKPREFRLLEYLMMHARQVVTRNMLLEHVWGYHFDPGSNVVDVYISRLRGKVDEQGEVPLLQTVRGLGYRLGEPS